MSICPSPLFMQALIWSLKLIITLLQMSLRSPWLQLTQILCIFLLTFDIVVMVGALLIQDYVKFMYSVCITLLVFVVSLKCIALYWTTPWLENGKMTNDLLIRGIIENKNNNNTAANLLPKKSCTIKKLYTLWNTL